MKKKIMAAVLTIVMTMSMGMSASATSSTTSANSGNAGVAVDKALPGAAVDTDTVEVAVVQTNGTVAAVSLTKYVEAAKDSVIMLVAAKDARDNNAGEAVSALLTTPATPMFQATVNALDGNIGINNCGAVKTLASTRDAFGNIIASAGRITGVTRESLVMLMSVNADGTVEFVEGFVDPVTGQILGAFRGTPVTISVLVFIPGFRLPFVRPAGI